MKRTDWLIVLLFTAVWGIVAFATINDYGFTWDTGFHFYRGEAYWLYYKTGEVEYKKHTCPFQNLPFKDLVKSRELNHHPVLAPIITAISCDIFYKKLKILNPVDAHHAGIIILFLLTIPAFYSLIVQYAGREVASISTLFYLLYPRLLGHVHNNLKDVPVLCFFIFTFWAFGQAMRKKSGKWLVISAVLWGMGLAVKLTTFYIPIICLIWFFSANRRNVRGYFREAGTGFAVAFAGYLFIALAIFYALWPYLWFNLMENLKSTLNYYLEIGTTQADWRTTEEMMAERFWYPKALGYALITIPTLLIPLMVLGLKRAWKNLPCDKEKSGWFFFSWMILPILIVSIPGMEVYNGIRQFISFVPALCFFAGLGACEAAGKLAEKIEHRGHLKKSILHKGLLSGAVAVLIMVNIHLHPYQTVYFNILTGWLPGAQWIGVPEATDYWGNSYRMGTRWINDHAGDNALLSIPFGEHIIQSDKVLRPDIHLVTFEELQKKCPPQEGYIMFVTKKSWYNYMTDISQQKYKPIHNITILGAPILKIYRL